MTNKTTTTESKALTLLGQGVSPQQVAAALGVSQSRISQLLSDPEFVAEIATLRYESLQKHNARDAKYDELEDSLLKRLSDCLPLMYKPAEILKAVQIINAAKRRGSDAPLEAPASSVVVNITLPAVAVTKFVTNIHNQVIQAGSQELLTIQSGTLLKEMRQAAPVASQPSRKQLQNVNTTRQAPRTIEESLGFTAQA